MASEEKQYIALPELAALAVVIMSAAALVYNVGFFAVVGMRLVTSFTLQEHFVFGLTGATMAILVVGAAGSIIRSWERLRKLAASRPFKAAPYILVFLSSLFIALVAAALVWPSPLGWPLVFLGFGYTLLIAATIVVLYEAPKTRSLVLPGAFLLSLVVFTTGVLAALSAVFSPQSCETSSARTLAGERLKLIRFGSEYSIVGDAGNVLLLRTDDIERIVAWPRFAAIFGDRNCGAM